ncbi:hypothetical protein Tco_1056203 [Tanacetum coccineum]|uniref:Uncharacterized protein n=1 Tax=Tanacetum coccineum TaxID=301880 RepID=A0ABQ5H204_9ASTR
MVYKRLQTIRVDGETVILKTCVYLKAGNRIREDFKITHRDEYESEDDNSMDEEGEVKKNGIKDEHSDGEIVPESLFKDGELENNHVDVIFSKRKRKLKHPPGFHTLTHNCKNDTSEKKVDQNDNSVRLEMLKIESEAVGNSGEVSGGFNGKEYDDIGVYAPQRVKKNKLFGIFFVSRGLGNEELAIPS